LPNWRKKSRKSLPGTGRKGDQRASGRDQTRLPGTPTGKKWGNTRGRRDSWSLVAETLRVYANGESRPKVYVVSRSARLKEPREEYCSQKGQSCVRKDGKKYILYKKNIKPKGSKKNKKRRLTEMETRKRGELRGEERRVNSLKKPK